MHDTKLPKQLLLVTIFLVGAFPTWSAEVFEAGHAGWRLEGDAERLEEIDGRSAIKISRGNAFLDEVDFENGVIEFDIYTSGERAFVYFLFRGESDVEFEEIYLRPHKSGLPDALQYAPVFQRRSAWQLYHGETGTAAVVIAPNEWVPVRMELNGPKAKIWIGEGEDPALIINELGRKPGSGWMAFRGFIPANSPAKYAAYFSNLRINATAAPPKAKIEKPDLPEGQVTQWRVSPAFEVQVGPVLTIPDEIAEVAWSTPIVQRSGVFEFLRSRAVPENARRWAVVADVTLKAKQAQVCAMHLGFSDDITLSVNGQLALYQEANYRFDSPRQDGVMHADQIIAYLHLNKGDNFVRAVIADGFGGWGFSARLQECTGVESL